MGTRLITLGSILACIVEDLIRWISGPVGVRIRRAWYSRRFHRCGDGLVVKPGVQITGSSYIEVGNCVWIDRNVILVAGPPRETAQITVRSSRKTVDPGWLRIGNSSHLGIGTIIQAHGGIHIDDYFTSSAGVKIFSFSNDVKESRAGTIDDGDARTEYVLTPVHIHRNVWLGLDVILIGHEIGANCFIKPKSVVTTDIPENTISSGNPARVHRARFDETER